MSTTGLEVFDTTVHKTNRWLNQLMEVLGTKDRHRAYLALRAVLHATRDRLTVDEAAQLSAQLPMLVRGFYFEGWDPTGKPLKMRHRAEFLARVQADFRGGDGVDPEQMARAVFAVLAQSVSAGEISDVKHAFPEDVRDLWPH
jgi:uncharacterized protein (DUF2267 family)